jgi:hypothetical protein
MLSKNADQHGNRCDGGGNPGVPPPSGNPWRRTSCRSLYPLLTKPSEFHQIARTFGTAEDMQILRIFEIEFPGSFDQNDECCTIETSDPVWVGVVFEHVLLEAFKQESVVLIIPD